MAKIKFSAIAVTDMRGKSGGSVFSKNKGGSYTKNFVVPSNPATVAQQAVRALFGSIASLWRSLTQPQRNGWNSKAPSFPYTDVFGDTKTLSGFGLHQKLNGNLQNSGQSLLSDAPDPVGTSGISDDGDGIEIDLTADTATTTLNFADAQPSAGVLVVEATPALSAGIKNFGTNYRKIFTQAVAADATDSNPTPADMYTAYVDRFGTPEAGANIGFRYKVINDVGETTVYFKASAVDVVPGV